MKKSILSFMFLLASVNTYAFTLNNTAKLVFAEDEVKVNVASGCLEIGITSDELLELVGKAVDNFWNKSPTSRLKLRKGSVVNVDSRFHSDQICTPTTNCEPNPVLAVESDILITCNDSADNFPNSSILGITIPNNIAGGTIIGSLIMINDKADTQFDTKSEDAKVAILAHEIGHAFGLGHSPVQDSLMYYATVSQRKALGRDDIDGISYLYPKQQPISGCGTVDMSGGKGGGSDWWSGLFLGFSIIGFAEIYRNRKSKLSNRSC
jgi:hypothetical protein